MQIWNWKKTPKNLTKIWSWDGLGVHFGRLRDGLGPLLGALGRLLAVLGRSKSSFFSALALDGLQDAFCSDFESILGGIREDLGRIWEGLKQNF